MVSDCNHRQLLGVGLQHGIEGVNEGDHEKTGAPREQVWKEEESQMEKWMEENRKAARARDDVSRKELDAEKARETRKFEMDLFRKMGVYRKVKKSSVLQKGEWKIGVRWIDINKQDAANPLYRSRLVGKEFNTHNHLSLYAATPPIEALRLILHIAATNQYNGAQYKVMTNDVSRAYFYAPIQEGQYIYVKLPEEDRLPGEEQMCGR